MKQFFSVAMKIQRYTYLGMLLPCLMFWAGLLGMEQTAMASLSEATPMSDDYYINEKKPDTSILPDNSAEFSKQDTTNRDMMEVPKDATFEERMEIKWRNLLVVLNMKDLSIGEKLKSLYVFREEYGKQTPHSEELEFYFNALIEKKDPSEIRFLSPERLKTKTEWFSFRSEVGNYGGGGMLSFFTLRWNHFFLEIFRIGGGAGKPIGYDTILSSWAVAGTLLGMPLHLGYDGRKEIRLGIGFEGGFIFEYPGANFLFEAMYVWHHSEYFALQAGIETRVVIPMIKDFVAPAPMVTVFFGFRI